MRPVPSAERTLPPAFPFLPRPQTSFSAPASGPPPPVPTPPAKGPQILWRRGNKDLLLILIRQPPFKRPLPVPPLPRPGAPLTLMSTFAWTNVSRATNHVCQCPRSVFFHSTSALCAKRKGKFDYGKDEKKGGQPPKNHIRYVVRQKRADAKRALNDFLSKGTKAKQSVQNEWAAWFANSKRNAEAGFENVSDDFYGRAQSIHSGRSKPGKPSSKKENQHGKKSKNKWSIVSDDDEMHSGTTFEVNFGGKCYTWSFGGDFQSSAAGFKWRDNSEWTKNENEPCGGSQKEKASSWRNSTRRRWSSESDFDDDADDNSDLASRVSCSHRVTLGLPSTGPIKLEDVKNAFRASALKWHPDKHQGPSQVMAGEKFKRCVDAYQSLCSALNSS